MNVQDDREVDQSSVADAGTAEEPAGTGDREVRRLTPSVAANGFHGDTAPERARGR